MVHIYSKKTYSCVPFKFGFILGTTPYELCSIQNKGMSQYSDKNVSSITEMYVSQL